jgi:hypothetical protein
MPELAPSSWDATEKEDHTDSILAPLTPTLKISSLIQVQRQFLRRCEPDWVVPSRVVQSAIFGAVSVWREGVCFIEEHDAEVILDEDGKAEDPVVCMIDLYLVVFDQLLSLRVASLKQGRKISTTTFEIDHLRLDILCTLFSGLYLELIWKFREQFLIVRLGCR